MYVVIHQYKARPGEEDALVALHEDWERTLGHGAKGYISGELLHDTQDVQHFMSIARYESEMAYHKTANDAEIQSWRRRLASLSEEEPAFTCWFMLT